MLRLLRRWAERLGAREDISLGDRERTFKVILYDGDYGFAVNIVKNLYLGPGKPGPEDEWKMPRGPIDEIVTQDDEVAEPAQSSRGGLLRRLTRRG
jgi:hypothetical protein